MYFYEHCSKVFLTNICETSAKLYNCDFCFRLFKMKAKKNIGQTENEM